MNLERCTKNIGLKIVENFSKNNSVGIFFCRKLKMFSFSLKAHIWKTSNQPFCPRHLAYAKFIGNLKKITFGSLYETPCHTIFLCISVGTGAKVSKSKSIHSWPRFWLYYFFFPFLKYYKKIYLKWVALL